MGVIAGDVTVRDATEDDVDFVAWVMLTASRSQLDRGIWEYLYDADAAATLGYLKALAITETVHIFHHSLFQIAEVDGIPAAAMCGYEPLTQGFAQYGLVAPQAAEDAGIAMDDGFGHRLEVLMAGFTPEVAENPWVVENVATSPEFRRMGLVDRLLRDTLARGREKGFRQGQIGVFIGNERAKKAYEKAGFEKVDEKRDPRWDAEIGCPGTEVMLQEL